jgi:hypothetical protein
MHLSCFTSKYKYADFPKLVQNVQIVCTKETKKKVAAQIARIINDKGVFPQKNAKQVENKIRFRTAHDWASMVTGAGLQENDRGSFNDAIKYGCPQYFFLVDGMIERSSMQPKATNMNLDSSESDDNMGDDDEEDEDGEVVTVYGSRATP